MRIAIFISTLEFGGAEKQAVIDAALLAQENQVFFFVFQKGLLAEQLPASVELIEIKKDNYFSTARRLFHLLKEKKIEVIHTHLYAPMMITCLSTLMHHIPVVCNLHGHAYESKYHEKLAPGLVSRLPGVKRILFPASELKNYYRTEKAWFPAKKEQVIYNSGQFREELPCKDNEGDHIIIGYIGRIVPLKRIHLLVKLAQELKEEGMNSITVSIVGDGITLPEIKAEAKEKGVADVIEFHGFQADTPTYYQSFSIFALPSEEECLSLSLIDAQLTGLPSVAFDVGGNSDIIEDGHSGFIVKTTREFMARIKELARDQGLRNRMGRRALARARANSVRKAGWEN